MNEQAEKRTDRRRRRQRRSTSGIVWIAVAIAAVLALVIGIKLFSGVNEKGGTLKVSRRSPAVSAPSELKDNTYLVVGVKKEGDKESLSGILQFVIDEKRGSIGGIVVPTNTFLDVSGRGFEPIGDGYAQGIDVIAETLGSFIGVKASHNFIVPDDLFINAVKDGDVKRLIGGKIKTDMQAGEVRDLMVRVNAVSRKNVSLIDLPVRPISFGSQTYFDAKKKELSRLTKMFWQVKQVKSDNKVRIIILNGSGTPGIARKAADSLLSKGYKIVDIKNADKFDYPSTQIVVYNESKSENAWEIRKILNRGDIQNKNTPQDVVDVLVILGRDYE